MENSNKLTLAEQYLLTLISEQTDKVNESNKLEKLKIKALFTLSIVVLVVGILLTTLMPYLMTRKLEFFEEITYVSSDTDSGVAVYQEGSDNTLTVEKGKEVN